MIPSYEMTVAANKWLGKHLLFFVLMQEKDAPRWFHWWDYGPLSGCHMTACFYCILLPFTADNFIFMGSIVWRVTEVLEMPIGSVILPTLHVAYSGVNNGQPVIAILHLFSSCGRSHLKNLSSWRRHFMADFFVGVTWAILGGHVISAQGKKQPHTYHKWREKQLGKRKPISPCSPTTLHKLGLKISLMSYLEWLISFG